MTEKRKIGRLADITPVGLGCMGFSHAYGAPTERKEAVGMIRKAYGMGYDFFDTAECYTGMEYITLPIGKLCPLSIRI